MDATSYTDIHVKMRISGRAEMVDAFKSLLGQLDKDFPWHPAAAKQVICEGCEGVVWRLAVLELSDVKAAAHQLGIKVKVQQWWRKSDCQKRFPTAEESSASPNPPNSPDPPRLLESPKLLISVEPPFEHIKT